MSSSADWRTTNDIDTLNKLIKARKDKLARAMSKDTKVTAKADILMLDGDADPDQNRLQTALFVLLVAQVSGSCNHFLSAH